MSSRGSRKRRMYFAPSLFHRYAEMSDVLGLFAPRPVVIVAGEKDKIFPISGIRKAYRHLRKIYSALGTEKHCHLVIGGSGHRFYAKLAWSEAISELKLLTGK